MGTRCTFLRVGALLLALPVLITGCAAQKEDTAVDAFIVAGSEPETGTEDATVATQPEFVVSAAADAATCTVNSLSFHAIGDDGGVLFDVPYSIVLESEGSRIRFLHEDPLLEGFHYAAYVNTQAETICTDVDGRALEPFGMEFYVP